MKSSFLGLSALVLVAACEGTPDATRSAETKSATDPHAGLTNYDCNQVEQMLASHEAVAVDVNSTDTRMKLGTLPGAVLLSGSDDYDLSELPSDKSKSLVFYCGGKRCTSAPKAAKRAEAAGYAHVGVMRDGIWGWVKAGKGVDQKS